MAIEDKLSLEERTKLIKFSRIGNYKFIDTIDPDRKITYKTIKIKPQNNEPGKLEIAFVFPMKSHVSVIEARLSFNEYGEFINDDINISKQHLTSNFIKHNYISDLESLKKLSNTWAFDYGKACHDKIIELYKELIKH